MREILFKAKRIDNGEWLEGLVSKIENTFCLIREYGSNISYECDVNTLRQYTGLTDKNGNKIWENDVCRYIDGDECRVKEEIFVVKYGRYAESCKINIGFYIDWIKADYYRCDLVFWAENRNIEVVGNIFDNPELIKGV